MADNHDPKGLIRESYRIDGISDAECRSILIDWALSLPAALDQKDALMRLRSQYAVDHPTHPMTALIAQGLEPPKRQGRRKARER